MESLHSPLLVRRLSISLKWRLSNPFSSDSFSSVTMAQHRLKLLITNLRQCIFPPTLLSIKISSSCPPSPALAQYNHATHNNEVQRDEQAAAQAPREDAKRKHLRGGRQQTFLEVSQSAIHPREDEICTQHANEPSGKQSSLVGERSWCKKSSRPGKSSA